MSLAEDDPVGDLSPGSKQNHPSPTTPSPTLPRSASTQARPRGPHQPTRAGRVETEVKTGGRVLESHRPPCRREYAGMLNQEIPQQSLATDIVRFVGKAVAAVVTQEPYQGEDAIELVSVDYTGACRKPCSRHATRRYSLIRLAMRVPYRLQ